MKQPPSSSNNLEASLPVKLLTAGTSACIADLLTFPLDTAKVRLQVCFYTTFFVTFFSLKYEI